MTPKAIVVPLSDFSGFRVYTDHLGMKMPAGPRLARLKPLPDDHYTFETEDEAQAAADRLQTYIDEHHRPPGKRTRRRRR